LGLTDGLREKFIEKSVARIFQRVARKFFSVRYFIRPREFVQTERIGAHQYSIGLDEDRRHLQPSAGGSIRSVTSQLIAVLVEMH
jgi:hypothetical protein